MGGEGFGEALDLCPKDIDLERGSIRILSGKGGYARTAGIDQGGIAYLREWLDVRSTFDLNGCHPLLCAASGGLLDLLDGDGVLVLEVGLHEIVIEFGGLFDEFMPPQFGGFFHVVGELIGNLIPSGPASGLGG